jgi:hypothetical protein
MITSEHRLTHYLLTDGWESFQIFEAAQPDKTYDLYTQMKHHKADLYHGDTVVLDGTKVVAFFKGLSVSS